MTQKNRHLVVFPVPDAARRELDRLRERLGGTLARYYADALYCLLIAVEQGASIDWIEPQEHATPIRLRAQVVIPTQLFARVRAATRKGPGSLRAFGATAVARYAANPPDRLPPSRQPPARPRPPIHRPKRPPRSVLLYTFALPGTLYETYSRMAAHAGTNREVQYAKAFQKLLDDHATGETIDFLRPDHVSHRLAVRLDRALGHQLQQLCRELRETQTTVACTALQRYLEHLDAR